MAKRDKSIKNVMFRIEDFPEAEQEKYQEWFFAQKSNQQSLSILIQFAIDHFGYTDVLDYQNLQRLFSAEMRQLLGSPGVHLAPSFSTTPQQEIADKQGQKNSEHMVNHENLTESQGTKSNQDQAIEKDQESGNSITPDPEQHAIESARDDKKEIPELSPHNFDAAKFNL